MTIGEALKQIRLQAGLTQTQMAADIITESFYSKVERGVHSIDADTLINLLTAHHLDVIHFFTLIANQKSVAQPHFDLVNKITFAQNRKDIRALDKIASEIQNGEVVRNSISNFAFRMLMPGYCILTRWYRLR